MKIKNVTALLIILFLFSLAVASNVSAADAWWRGFVLITNDTGNNLTSQAGIMVVSYVNGTWKKNVTTGSQGSVGSGYYIIEAPGDAGDVVTFRISGSPTDNATPEAWAPGIHPGSNHGQWFNLTFTTIANGAACNHSLACRGGYCCSGATEILMAPPYTGTAGTCQATACSAGGGSSSGGGSSGGGSSGGGGGVATVSETSTVSGTVASGATTTFPFQKAADTGVSSIEVTTSGVVTNPQITVKETTLGTGQQIAISADAGAVYQYLTITKTNIKDTDIQGAKVKFQVLKSWAVTNDIDPKTIALTKFVSNAWAKQPTTFLKEDNTYYYYEATVTGFSLFAVTGEKLKAKPAVPPAENVTPSAPVCGNNACESGETSESCPSDCPKTEEKPKPEEKPVPPPEKRKIPLTGIVIAAAIVAVGLVAAFLMMRKKKGVA